MPQGGLFFCHLGVIWRAWGWWSSSLYSCYCVWL